MKRKALFGFVAALVLMTAMLGMTGCRHHGKCGGSHAAMMAMVRDRLDDGLGELNATEAQKTAVFGAVDEVVAEFKAFHDRSRDAHDALIEQWRSDQPDADTINAVVDDRLQDFNGLARFTVNAVVKLHGVFTPEQRNQLADKLEEHMAER
jgi:Spy/CpxP family protein refolding chaperone